MERQNYYLLLGLSFDPPQTDIETIRRAIREYIGAATDADRDERYLIASDMNSLLLAPNRAEERKQEAEKAAAIAYEALDRVIREAAYMSNPPALSAMWIERIAAAAGFPESVVERRMKRSAKLILSAAEELQRFDPDRMLAINRALSEVRADSLNGYLLRYMPAGLCGPNDVWKQDSMVIYNAVNAALRQSKSPEEKNMASILLAFYNNEKLLQAYEAELEMAPVFRLVDEMKTLDRAGLLARSPQEAAKVYERLKEWTNDERYAMKLYKALFFHPLAMPMPEKTKIDRDATVCCNVCGTIQRVSRQSKMICRHCQSPLSCKCEKCGQWFAAAQQGGECPYCGYDRIRELRVRERMRLSKAAGAARLQEQAAGYRRDAFRLDAELAAELDSEVNGKILRRIEQMQNAHCFYALRELLEQEKEIDGWEELNRQAQDAIDCVESMLGQLDKMEEDQQYLLLRAVTALCSDIPDLDIKAACYIPPAPGQVRCVQKNGSIDLKWMYPDRPEARFCIARRTDHHEGGEVRYEIIDDDLICPEYCFDEEAPAGYYAVRAELFGAVSAWVSVGWLGREQVCDDLRAKLTAQGMELTWRSRSENAQLVLKKKTKGSVKELAHLPVGTSRYLDAGFDRNEQADYYLVPKDRKQGDAAVRAGIEEKQVLCEKNGVGSPDCCVYLYEPDDTVSVAWYIGSEDDLPLKPGVYMEDELCSAGLSMFESASSGRMECRPLPGGGGFVQPVWRGGGCLRAGAALYPMPNVEPFREIVCTCCQKGLWHIEAQWPENAGGAVITACAARYAEPGTFCGEITLNIVRKSGEKMEADIPWALTPYVCIAVRAYRELQGVQYLSGEYRIPVDTLPVVWRFGDRSGKRWLNVEFAAAKHTVYHPALDAVSSETGNRFQAVRPGILKAGNGLRLICELPDGVNWDSVVWNGEEHDLFTLLNGEGADER